MTQDGGITSLWTHDYWAGRAPYRNLYRPITILSYHANARLPGASAHAKPGVIERIDPAALRLVNLALLACVAWVAGLWLGRYTHWWAGWAAALLLALHPSNAYLINPIVGRADLLAMLGAVTFGYLQKRANDAGRWSPVMIAGAVIAVIVALGSKESGLIVVPIAVAQAWVGRAGARTPRRVHVIAAALLTIPLLAYGIARIVLLDAISDPVIPMADLSGNPLRGLTAQQRLPAAFAIAWFYLSQTLWPDLSFFHVPNTPTTTAGPAAWLGMITVVLLIAALYYLLSKRHWVSIGLAAALGQYLLVGNLLTPIGVYAADRLMLPFIFCAVAIAAWALARLGDTSVRRRNVSLGLCAALSIAMALTTAIGVNPRWSSAHDLTASDLRGEPDNLVKQYNHATVLVYDVEGDPDQRRRWAGQAADLLENILERRPDSLQARYQLCTTYYLLTRYDEALHHLHQFLQHDDTNVDVHKLIAEIHIIRQQWDQAEVALERAHALTPTDAAILQNREYVAAMQRQGDR